jgi:hypothetical protein
MKVEEELFKKRKGTSEKGEEAREGNGDKYHQNILDAYLKKVIIMSVIFHN